MDHTVSVSIVYALPEQQWLKKLTVPRGTNASELLELSGLRDVCDRLKNVNTQELQLGIYAEKVSDDYLLQEGDRLEIYRPLSADPKEVRRQLALIGKTMGKSK